MILDWPVLAFLFFFVVQLFGFEPIGGITKPFLGAYSQHLAFLVRISITLIFWRYLFSDWHGWFDLNPSAIPQILLVITSLYAVLFFPLPIPDAVFPVDKISLHILISVWEEFLMRGLLLAILLRAYPNSVMSVVISVGCLFGILHLLNLLQGAEINDVLPQIIWSCSLGISFAVITYFSGSLIPAILLHCGFNLIPAIWDGKPWIVTKAHSFGYYGLPLVVLLFIPLVVLSLKKIVVR